MKKLTHLAIGVITILEISILSQKIISPITFIIACICSLFPDIYKAKDSSFNEFIFTTPIKNFIRYLLYFINMISFIILLYINKNLIFNLLLSFILIIFIETKLKHILLRNSMFTLLFAILTYSLFIIQADISIIILSFLFSISPWLIHEKFTHSLLGIFTIYIFLHQIENLTHCQYLAFFGSIGYASHMFLGDIFTKSGISIFYPIKRKKISLSFFNLTGILGDFFQYIYVLIFMTILFFTFNFKVHL